jgi:hypothetical protein
MRMQHTRARELLEKFWIFRGVYYQRCVHGYSDRPFALWKGDYITEWRFLAEDRPRPLGDYGDSRLCGPQAELLISLFLCATRQNVAYASMAALRPNPRIQWESDS